MSFFKKMKIILFILSTFFVCHETLLGTKITLDPTDETVIELAQWTLGKLPSYTNLNGTYSLVYVKDAIKQLMNGLSYEFKLMTRIEQTVKISLNNCITY